MVQGLDSNPPFKTQDSLKPLFVLQKRALRNLFSIKRESKYVKGHTKSKFNELSILTVYNLYNYATLLHLIKLLYLKKPMYLYELHGDQSKSPEHSYMFYNGCYWPPQSYSTANSFLRLLAPSLLSTFAA